MQGEPVPYTLAAEARTAAAQPGAVQHAGRSRAGGRRHLTVRMSYDEYALGRWPRWWTTALRPLLPKRLNRLDRLELRTLVKVGVR